MFKQIKKSETCALFASEFLSLSVSFHSLYYKSLIGIAALRYAINREIVQVVRQ